MSGQAGAGGFRFGGAFVGGVILLLLLLLALSEFGRLRQGGELKAVKADAAAALASVITPSTIEEASRSVYLVIVDGRPFGTAFVIDQERGVLGTAAHVAESVGIYASRKIEVLNAHTGKPLRVTGASAHAGFRAFQSLIADYKPVQPSSRLVAPEFLGVDDIAFDVGLLMVDGERSEAGDPLLGPSLRIAGEPALLQLRSGDPIAIIGFPQDVLSDGLTAATAVPRAERGIVDAMIAPLATIDTAADPEISNIIMHRLPVTYGDSGAPLLNGAGEVVGVHTHGEPSAAANISDRAAQRADMLLDLIEPLREQRRLAELFLPAWRARLEAWRKGEDVAPWAVYERRRPGSMPRGDAERIDAVDFAARRPFKAGHLRLRFEAMEAVHFVAASDLGSSEQICEDGGGNAVCATKAPAFEIKGAGYYYDFGPLTLDRSVANAPFAFSHRVDGNQPFCPITIYWRAEGEDALRIAGSPIWPTDIYLPPVAGGKEENIYLTFRRPAGCGSGRDFVFGVVTWEAEPAPADTRTAQDSAVVASLPALTQARLYAANAISCRLGFAGSAACISPSINWDGSYRTLPAGAAKALEEHERFFIGHGEE